MSKKLFATLFLTIVLNGCAFGWLYTDTVTPLCTDMRNTSADGKNSTISLKEISIPRIPGARTMWSSNAIGDAAKEGGINVIHYCDRKNFKILGGLWGSDSVVVYGE